MTDTDQKAPAGSQFNVHRIYIKDLSFESPNSPQVFTEEWKPEVSVNLNTDFKDLGDDNYEVVLTASVSAKQGEKNSFLAEVQQAGIFQISGANKQQINATLSVSCPNILFPYAREAISDLITRGSFPQFLLAPVSFENLYLQQQKQKSAESH